MTLPEPQLVLDDLFADMLQNLGELVESALFGEDEPGYLTSDQLTSREREWVWECLARTLLLCQSAHGTTQNRVLGANKGER